MNDVLRIAIDSKDVDQAKRRIGQLFFETKAQHRGHLAVAQRIRDQLNRTSDDSPIDAQVCIDRVLEWLDRDHLATSRQRD